MKSALKKAGLIAAPLALAIGLSAALAAPQTGTKPCYKLTFVPTWIQYMEWYGDPIFEDELPYINPEKHCIVPTWLDCEIPVWVEVKCD